MAKRPGREDEAYAAGRLAGYEEGIGAAAYAPAMLAAWRKTKDFLRDRLLTTGRSDVNINAVLRVMNEALNEPEKEHFCDYRDAFETVAQERDELALRLTAGDAP